MRRTILFDRSGAAWNVDVPETWQERMRGLVGAPPLSQRHAMLLERCRSVHTVGMGFPIAVVFLDREVRVVDVRRVPPGRWLRPRLRARHVLECPPDAEVRAGDRFTTAPPLYSVGCPWPGG